MVTRIATLVVWVCVAMLSGCAPKPYDYTQYLTHMPRSVLVLPPVNHTAEVTAPDAFLGTVSMPLAERGYYVFPIAVVDQFMKENGLPTPGDMHQAPLDKLGSVFGADAVLYIDILEWETRYILIDSSTHVRLRFRLVDIKAGLEIWQWEQHVVQSSSQGQSNIIAMAIAAAIHQATSGVVKRERELAVYANQLAIHDQRTGMLLGHRHPGYALDQQKRHEEVQKLQAAAPPTDGR